MTSTTSLPTLCDWCIHYQGIKDKKIICEAFPDGTPEEIMDLRFDHRNPHPEDNGIQFKKQEDQIQWSDYLKSLMVASPYKAETLFQIISENTESGLPFEWRKYPKDRIQSSTEKDS